MDKMKEIVLATKSKGKIKEIKPILEKYNFKIYTLADFPKIKDIAEDGKSYAENALKKAKAIAKFTKKIALSDDSGLEIEALNGKPNIHSARFGGAETSYQEKNKIILQLLKDVPLKKRKAKYICVMALSLPSNKVWTAEGKCSGRISLKAKGRYGFGYDPIFFVPKYNCSIAELNLKIKNKISHRGKALKKIIKILRKIK